jgi:cysteine desulfurase
MTANHETGVLHPLESLISLCKECGGWLHTDASQAFGKVPVDSKKADLITLSSHKIGGPVGIGALVIKPHVPFTPPILGGGQEDGVRSGTTSLLLVEGFVAAAEEALVGHFKQMNQLSQWRQAMEKRLQDEVPGLRIWGYEASRLPQTTYLSMPDISKETQLIAMNLANIAVSGGAACSSGLKGASPVLTAMGASSAEAECALRMSMGRHTTEDDVQAFTQAWLTTYHQHKKRPLNHAA